KYPRAYILMPLAHPSKDLHGERLNIPSSVRMIALYGFAILECSCCTNKLMKLLQVYSPWKHADD
ncbi:MAG: hypothetical protein WKF91_16515, partial [Segetibacter sp.]